MLNKRTLKNIRVIAEESFSLLVADLVYRASNVLLVWLIARYLGPASIGIYTLGSTLRSTFQLMTLSGTGYLIIRELSRGSINVRKYMLSFTLMRSILSLLGWLLLWVLIGFLKPPYYPEGKFVILLMGLELFPEGVREICRAYFIAQRYIALYTLIAVTTGFSRLIMGGWLLLRGENLIEVVGANILLTWAGNGLGFITLLISLKRSQLEADIPIFSTMRKQFTMGLPFVAINILLVAYAQANVYLLSAFSTIEEVGFYGVADSIVTASSLFTQVYLSLLLPIFAQLYKINKQRFELIYHSSLRVLSGIAFPIALIIAFQADTLATIFGWKFQRVSTVISLLIWSLVISWLNTPNSCVMIAIGYEKVSARFLFLALIINLVSGLLLIPGKGAIGAALARIIAEAVFWIVHWRFVRKNVVQVPVHVIGQPLIALIAMGFTMFILSGRSIMSWVAVFVGILVYVGVFRFWAKVHNK